MTADELSAGLARVCARAGLGALSLAPRRLTGGAVMESWRFAAGDSAYVLRRAPSLAFMEGRPYPRHKPFEHIYRHHRRYRITEGSEEIQMRKVGAYLFGYLGPKRGQFG